MHSHPQYTIPQAFGSNIRRDNRKHLAYVFVCVRVHAASDGQKAVFVFVTKHIPCSLNFSSIRVYIVYLHIVYGFKYRKPHELLATDWGAFLIKSNVCGVKMRNRFSLNIIRFLLCNAP